MDTMLKKTLLIFFMVLPLQAVQAKNCTLDTMIKNETRIIISKKNLSYMFPIHVFNKDIFIPNRFGLTILDNIDTSVIFTSGIIDQLYYAKAINCIGFPTLLGRIEIGNRKTCEYCNKSLLNKAGFKLIKENLTAKLKYRFYIHPNNKNKNITVIYDDNIYLLIIDYNPDLATSIIKQLRTEVNIEEIQKRYKEALKEQQVEQNKNY